jgi:hypothetical protein
VQDWKEERTAGYDPRVMYSTGGPICLVQLNNNLFFKARLLGERGGGGRGGGGRVECMSHDEEKFYR